MQRRTRRFRYADRRRRARVAAPRRARLRRRRAIGGFQERSRGGPRHAHVKPHAAVIAPRACTEPRIDASRIIGQHGSESCPAFSGTQPLPRSDFAAPDRAPPPSHAFDACCASVGKRIEREARRHFLRVRAGLFGDGSTCGEAAGPRRCVIAITRVVGGQHLHEARHELRVVLRELAIDDESVERRLAGLLRDLAPK